jgi:hypothetical protein
MRRPRKRPHALANETGAKSAQKWIGMRLDVVDGLSVAGGDQNEDRFGSAHALAWVIDGATDVLPAPLTDGGSDAAWFAGAMHAALGDIAADPPPSLANLPALMAARLAPEFERAAGRPPRDRSEHPSAAAMIVRAHADGVIEYAGLGDCVLLVETADGLVRVGVDEADAGDPWVAKALTGEAAGSEDAPPRDPLTRDDLWPRLRAQRARMNIAYGIFSITAPPTSMVRHGAMRCAPGDRLILASDGLTRLVDVFGRYDAAGLFAAAWGRGLAALVEELRALELDDAHCCRYPRAKISDDATGLLLRLKP